MKVSEVIKKLEKYKTVHGDVELLTIEDDGRSSWVVGYYPQIQYTKVWPMKREGHLIR